MNTLKNIDTSCPRCSQKFEIDKNRFYTVDKKNAYWFFEAMTQFENFSTVKCPECRNVFEAPEARLFGWFKSPYTIVVLSIVFGFMLLLLSYFLIKGNTRPQDQHVMEKLFLLYLSLSLIISGALMIKRQKAGPEEGFRGWSMIKGKAAIIIGVLTIVIGFILIVGSIII